MNSLGEIAAREGLSVLYVVSTAAERRTALDRLAADTGGVSRIRRAAGSERIDYISGGRIVIVSTNSRGGRGHSADVLSLTASDYASATIRSDVLPCLATSTVGAIIIRP